MRLFGGIAGVGARKRFGLIGGTRQDGVGNRGMLGPDRCGAIGGAQHEAHRAHELRPLLGDGVGDFRIAGEAVQARVERDVGGDELLDCRRFAERRAMAERLFEAFDIVGVRAAIAAALRGQACGEAIEHFADLIEVHDAVAVERRDGQPALAVLDQQAAALEDLQGVADRLARDAEQGGDAFLRQALTRREVAGRDRRDEPVVDLIDQGWACVQLLQCMALLAVEWRDSSIEF